MSKDILVPYTDTVNVDYQMVYSQEDHEEFTDMYDLMKHANKKQIALMRENEKLKKCVEFYAESDNWTSNSGKVGYGIGLAVHDTDFENVPNERTDMRWAGGKRARQCLKEINN